MRRRFRCRTGGARKWHHCTSPGISCVFWARSHIRIGCLSGYASADPQRERSCNAEGLSMRQPLAVIVGAGVAGLSAAWWLNRIGWQSLIIERAANLRAGGYMMSLSGPGYEVARRMGLMERLQQVRHRSSESIYFDKHGRELLRLRHREFLKEFSYLVLRRGDLVKALAEMTRADCDLRLSTEVARTELWGDRVGVTLSDGSAIEADLVIAADGVSSTVRREMIAADSDVMKPLGYRFAAYDVPDTLAPNADFLSYAAPGRISEFYKLSKGRLAALHVWSRPSPTRQGPPSAFDELADVFRDDHLNVRNIIAAGSREERPLLIDDMMLVEAPVWSRGRVVLTGDAAHCITLISGQGAGMAMTGAAVLADEIGRNENVRQALIAYEARMRGPIGRLQNRSRNIARWFVPHSVIGFHLRNFALRNMPSRMLARYFRRSLESEILASNLSDAQDQLAEPEKSR
ncbi:MAG: NAD(P)-binding protein [Rhizobiales bacterium]|nr:NAD(P)-binding protein [Hyphomicrobiales bacterium]